MSAPPRKQWLAPELSAAAAIAVTALAVVLGLIAKGWHAAHWWPVAGFLAVASVGFVYEVATLALARRLARGRPSAVPWDVPLRRPRWLFQTASLVWLSAGVGAVAGAAGFPAVGLGVALTVAGLSLFAARMARCVQPGWLTFERTGLRVGGPRFTFLVPWTSITDVRPVGTSAVLHILSRDPIIASVVPDTPENRRVVGLALLAPAGQPTLMLADWAGGFDAATLAALIETARGGRDPPN